MNITKDTIAALGDDDLYQLLSMVNDEVKVRTERLDLGEIRAFLANNTSLGPEFAADATAVAFSTDSWDDGYFYTEGDGVIFLSDGRTVSFSDGDDSVMHDVLTDLSYNSARDSGALNDSDMVRIDLVTGAVEYTSWYLIKDTER